MLKEDIADTLRREYEWHSRCWLRMAEFYVQKKIKLIEGKEAGESGAINRSALHQNIPTTGVSR